MIPVVIDTNCLIHCISRKSQYHEIWLAMLDGRIQLCVTNEIIDEYEEIIGRKTNARFASLAMDVILNNPYTRFVTPYYNFHVITNDPDDDKFVDCSVAAGAYFLVSQDNHYDVLKQISFPPVNLIGIDDFLAIIHKNS